MKKYTIKMNHEKDIFKRWWHKRFIAIVTFFDQKTKYSIAGFTSKKDAREYFNDFLPTRIVRVRKITKKDYFNRHNL